MFDCGVGSRGRKYFKFKNVAAIRGFFRAGQNVVAVLQIMRVLLVLCWDRNWKHLKADLKKWNEEVFGDVGKEMAGGVFVSWIWLQRRDHYLRLKIFKENSILENWSGVSILKKWVGDKSQWPFGWKRATTIRIFSIGWQIRKGEIIWLSP